MKQQLVQGVSIPGKDVLSWSQNGMRIKHVLMLDKCSPLLRPKMPLPLLLFSVPWQVMFAIQIFTNSQDSSILIQHALKTWARRQHVSQKRYQVEHFFIWHHCSCSPIPSEQHNKKQQPIQIESQAYKACCNHQIWNARNTVSVNGRSRGFSVVWGHGNEGGSPSSHARKQQNTWCDLKEKRIVTRMSSHCLTCFGWVDRREWVLHTPQEQAAGTPRSRKWWWKTQGRRCWAKGAARPTVAVHASSAPDRGSGSETWSRRRPCWTWATGWSSKEPTSSQLSAGATIGTTTNTAAENHQVPGFSHQITDHNAAASFLFLLLPQELQKKIMKSKSWWTRVYGIVAAVFYLL